MPATPHTPTSHECSTPNTPETLHECSLQPNISPGRKYRIQKFTDLDDDEKDNVKQLTAILNKFGVSFEAYHEISKIPGNEGLARSYLVEGCQGFLDAHWDITKTPDNTTGAELSFTKLLQDQLRKHVIIPFDH